MEFKDLSREMQEAIVYVAQHIDLDDAGSDLQEAMYQRCRLADISPWLVGRIEELMTEYCESIGIDKDAWEPIFSDEEEILGLAIDWDTLYGVKRYHLTMWYENGYIDEYSAGKNEADYILDLISKAENDDRVLSYALERDGIEIINTSKKVNHDVLD